MYNFYKLIRNNKFVILICNVSTYKKVLSQIQYIVTADKINFGRSNIGSIEVRQRRWMLFWPPLLPADKPTSIKHRGGYKYIDFYINLLNLTKPFNSGLKKWMRQAACHWGGMVSSNPRCWRGERLHHHGGGVCWLFMLLWMDLWCHETIVCEKWYKNNPK